MRRKRSPHAHYEPWGAETALDRSRLDEGDLLGIEVRSVGNPLDRRHRSPFGLARPDEAGADEHPVHEDRARSALTLLAGVLRPREPEVVPEELEKALELRDAVAALQVPVHGARHFHAAS